MTNCHVPRFVVCIMLAGVVGCRSAGSNLPFSTWMPKQKPGLVYAPPDGTQLAAAESDELEKYMPSENDEAVDATSAATGSTRVSGSLTSGYSSGEPYSGGYGSGCSSGCCSH
jgi:hypothetical protein